MRITKYWILMDDVDSFVYTEDHKSSSCWVNELDRATHFCTRDDARKFIKAHAFISSIRPRKVITTIKIV